MPREIVHWKVAARAAQELSKRGAYELAKAAAKYPYAFALGAVAHDAPYYRSGGASPFEFIGALLHGLGQASGHGDTLAPLARFIRDTLELSETHHREEALAFVLGLLSHYAADVVFHPLIFFVTGDYYAADAAERRAARGRHRLFEVYLDEHVRAGGVSFPWPLRIDQLVAALEPGSLRRLAALLGAAVQSEMAAVPALQHLDGLAEWEKSIKEMAAFQRWFVSPIGGCVARILKAASPKKLGQYETLFSFGRTGQHAVLNESLDFLNPVTGDPARATIAELEAAAIERTAALFLDLHRIIVERCDPREIFSHGLSLNYGIADGAPESAHHFSACGLPLPGLSLSRTS